ncbi:MAG TPA: hypothetical protein VG963_21175 [Polyangiaceae bacterium]|nr:hypothetical protein [Polyangiaceae bacterium]
MRETIGLLSVVAAIAAGCGGDDQATSEDRATSGNERHGSDAGVDAAHQSGSSTPATADAGHAANDAARAAVDAARSQTDAARATGDSVQSIADAASTSTDAAYATIADAQPVLGMDTPKDAGAAYAATVIVTSYADWVVFPDPYMDGSANPAADIQGSAGAEHTTNGMRVTLGVTGLPANRGFGAHLHKLPCDMMEGGGHYEHMPAPADAAPNDPAYENPMNEVWLDFTTNADGHGHAAVLVNWVPGSGEANSIIVHDHLTGDGGVAGPKLACLSFPFP